MSLLRPPCLSALILAVLPVVPGQAEDAAKPIDGALASRSFVDQAQIISKYTTEQYAHQSVLRIVRGIGYAVYQANDTTPEENKAGQVARMAIFNLLAPAATAKWLDISTAGDSSNGITVAGKFVSSPLLHQINDDTLRLFFTSRIEGDSAPTSRIFFKDYSISKNELSGLHLTQCTIAKNPAEKLPLNIATVQKHLDFLFGAGTGASYAKGISQVCDFADFDGQMYGTVQTKNSEGGKTLLMTNILMRSSDQGATWELLGAPDPTKLDGEIKILAEPALTQDERNVYLHLRSNVVENGYVLSKAAKSDLYSFDAPVKKWSYGIGRPTVCDYGKPIGMVAMFTAPTVYMGGTSVSRNACDVVRIDKNYKTYTKAFSIVDFNAVNTPCMLLHNEEIYVTYSTGRRRLIPKFGTSEIVFSKLRREYFFPTE